MKFSLHNTARLLDLSYNEFQLKLLNGQMRIAIDPCWKCIILTTGSFVAFIRTEHVQTRGNSSTSYMYNADSDMRLLRRTVSCASVTCMLWLELCTSLSKNAANNGHLSCIVSGTSDGHLQLHAQEGVLLLRQQLRSGTILSISRSTWNEGTEPGDTIHALTICCSSAILILTLAELTSVLASLYDLHHSQQPLPGLSTRTILEAVTEELSNDQRQQLWEQQWQSDLPVLLTRPTLPRPLSVRALAYPRGLSPRNGACVLGRSPPDLYSVLQGNLTSNKLLVAACGGNPCIAVLEAQEGGKPRSTLAALTGAVVSVGAATSSAVTGAVSLAASAGNTLTNAPSLIKQGLKSILLNPLNLGWSDRPDVPLISYDDTPTPTTEPTTLLRTFSDNSRAVTTLLPSPPGTRLLAAPDTLGRVLLLEGAGALAGVLVRMWKGYRDAQCGWLEVDARRLITEPQRQQEQSISTHLPDPNISTSVSHPNPHTNNSTHSHAPNSKTGSPSSNSSNVTTTLAHATNKTTSTQDPQTSRGTSSATISTLTSASNSGTNTLPSASNTSTCSSPPACNTHTGTHVSAPMTSTDPLASAPNISIGPLASSPNISTGDHASAPNTSADPPASAPNTSTDTPALGPSISIGTHASAPNARSSTHASAPSTRTGTSPPRLNTPTPTHSSASANSTSKADSFPASSHVSVSLGTSASSPPETAVARVALLVLYAPKRQTLEVWLPRHGPRLFSCHVGPHCRLVPVGEVLSVERLGASRSSGGGAGAVQVLEATTCALLDVDTGEITDVSKLLPDMLYAKL